MSKIIRLTESDLIRLVKRVIKEQSTPPLKGLHPRLLNNCFVSQGIPLDKLPQSCKDMINNKDEVNPFYVQCNRELHRVELFKTTDMKDKVDSSLNCVMGLVRL